MTDRPELSIVPDATVAELDALDTLTDHELLLSVAKDIRAVKLMVSDGYVQIGPLVEAMEPFLKKNKVAMSLIAKIIG